MGLSGEKRERGPAAVSKTETSDEGTGNGTTIFNGWAIKWTLNVTKLDRRSTGGIPRPLGKARVIPRKFHPLTKREKRGTPEGIGVPDYKMDNGENARMQETNMYAK